MANSQNYKEVIEFEQEPPHLGNQFLEDTALIDILKTKMPPEVFEEVSKDLTRFGHRVVTDLHELTNEAEKQPPRLIHYNQFGRRIDKIETSRAWKDLHAVSALEGIVAIGYERKQGEYRFDSIFDFHPQCSRLYQMSKLYLFGPSSAYYTCPLAMTDGAARTIEVVGSPELKKLVLPRLTSRDPRLFWTSGQWMTEKRGGSDVSGSTATFAYKNEDGTYSLYGFKWFTSATESEMALTLARIVKDGKYENGTKGLSMFYLKTRDEEGNLNKIKVHKLKDKLGTRCVPTAELSLHGSKAILVGEEGRGVANISHMLNITRMYNGIGSVGAMRRIIALARDYATRRMAFGKKLSEHALHLHTLAKLEVEFRGCLHFVMEAAYIMGCIECGKASQEDRDILRLITPLVKLYTAKKAMSVVSEGIEAIGGQAYMEDSGIARLLRDTQVLPIWEGTTNIQSLDTLRVFKKHPNSLKHLSNRITLYVEKSKLFLESNHVSPNVAEILKKSGEEILSSLLEIQKFVRETKCPKTMMASSRELAFSLSQTFIASLLLNHVITNKSKTYESDAIILHHYIHDHYPLAKLEKVDEDYRERDYQIGMNVGGFVDPIRSKM